MTPWVPPLVKAAFSEYQSCSYHWRKLCRLIESEQFPSIKGSGEPKFSFHWGGFHLARFEAHFIISPDSNQRDLKIWGGPQLDLTRTLEPDDSLESGNMGRRTTSKKCAQSKVKEQNWFLVPFPLGPESTQIVWSGPITTSITETKPDHISVSHSTMWPHSTDSSWLCPNFLSFIPTPLTRLTQLFLLKVEWCKPSCVWAP